MINKKILLIGGCGFIGHNLAIYLKKIGNNPIIVDSLQINNLYAKPDDEITNKHLYDSILNNRLHLLKESKIDNGELIVPAGVSYKFSGSYENQVRAEKRLSIIVPLVLVIIFLILYFQFKSISRKELLFTTIEMMNL